MQCETTHIAVEYALAFQQGDEKALAFFYGQFHPALSHYANRLLQNRSIAEEIASEAFIKIWRMHSKLSNYHVIRSYLYKTVHRECLHTIRKKRKMAEIHQNASRLTPPVDTPFDNLVRSEVYRIIHAALKDLSPANRKVIVMHFLEGKTSAEIAKELHLSSSTIRNQKMGALDALRKKLLRPTFLFYLIAKIFSPIF